MHGQQNIKISLVCQIVMTRFLDRFSKNV